MIVFMDYNFYNLEKKLNWVNQKGFVYGSSSHGR